MSIYQITKDGIEEMLHHSIIEMWEGNRYLVQRVTKHKTIHKFTKVKQEAGYIWLSCIDLNSCEKVRLRVKYLSLPKGNTPQNWSIDEWVDKSIWKQGEKRLYVKEWTNA